MDLKKRIFTELKNRGYSDKAAYAHLRGSRMPKYSVMLQLHQKGIVPFDAWRDIRQWLEKQSEEGKEKVARAGTEKEGG